MELQMLEVLLCLGKYISGICQEDVSSLSITGHILVLAFLEVFSSSSNPGSHSTQHAL